jgi:small GTP-binding protein
MSSGTYNISIIGGKGVGKTSICKRFVNNEFSEISKSEKEEEYFKNIKFKGNNIKLHILDPWENDPDLMETSIRTSASIIFVFSLEDKSTIESLKIKMNEVQQISGDIPFMIAGNKKDLQEQEITETIKEIMKELKVKENDIMEVSAKSGYNVEELFMGIVKKIFDGKAKTDEDKACCLML